MVITREEQLETDGLWLPHPSKMHLDELAKLAIKRGLLTQPVTDPVLEILKVRIMAAHPLLKMQRFRSAWE